MSTPAPEISAPEGFRSAPILPLLVFGFGAYLLWFGVRYWKGSGAAVWPSYPIRSVLTGQGVPPNVSASGDASATLTAYESQVNAAEVAASAGGSASGTAGQATGTGQKPGTTTAGGRGTGTAPAAPANAGGNVGLGKLLAQPFGWSSGGQWNALYALWQRESGWSNTARNPSSGAYGIPQALPPTKLPAAAQASGGSNARAQILWGLGYIQGRYGSPEGALAHENALGWY